MSLTPGAAALGGYAPDPSFTTAIGHATSGMNAIQNQKLTGGTITSGQLGQQELWPDANFWVAVHKARNGHVVRMARHIGDRADLWIVPEGQSVPETIAAAIAAHALEK